LKLPSCHQQHDMQMLLPSFYLCLSWCACKTSPTLTKSLPSCLERKTHGRTTLIHTCWFTHIPHTPLVSSATRTWACKRSYQTPPSSTSGVTRLKP
jgi:hypothetical protein